MLISKRKFREIVVQILFSQELAVASEEDTCALLVDLLNEDQKDYTENILEAYEYSRLIKLHQDKIDQLLRDHAKSFSLERIQYAEKAILRLAVYEMVFEGINNQKIVISEALSLCNKFCAVEAVNFINGVLDAIYQSTQK